MWESRVHLFGEPFIVKKKLGIPLSNIQKIVLKLGSRGALGVTGEGAPGNHRNIRVTISQSTGYNMTDIQRN